MESLKRAVPIQENSSSTIFGHIRAGGTTSIFKHFGRNTAFSSYSFSSAYFYSFEWIGDFNTGRQACTTTTITGESQLNKYKFDTCLLFDASVSESFLCSRVEKWMQANHRFLFVCVFSIRAKWLNQNQSKTICKLLMDQIGSWNWLQNNEMMLMYWYKKHQF